MVYFFKVKTLSKDNSIMSVQYVLSDKSAIVPTMGSKLAAGYDLFSIEEKIIPAKGRTLFSTGVCIRIPEGCYGRICPRSGLALKHGIDVGAGVIDRDYTGIIHVLLFNHDDQDYKVKCGDRIAQLIFEKIINPDFQLVETLEITERNESGFGSTGC